MKIKQDRASRTYELQVCVISAGGGCSPRPPPRCHPLHTPQSPTVLNLFLRTCPSSLSPSRRGLQCPWCPKPDRPVVSATPPLFPGLFPAPSLAMTYPSLTHLLSLLIPSPLLCCSPTPTSGCSPHLSSSRTSNFSALPTGPSDLRASLLAKHPLWLLWGLRFQAGVTRATPALPGPPPSTLDAHLQGMWSSRLTCDLGMSVSFLKIFTYFIYMVMLGLRCSMWNL